MGICEVDGCGAETHSSGGRWNARPHSLAAKYCRKHLRWLETYGSLEPPKMSQGTLEFRFWKHVDKRSEDECWDWKADCSRSGYGGLWDNQRGKNISAHRLSYEIHRGPIEKGMYVIHSCDNKRCVNPKHLEQGSPKKNTNDAIDRGLRPKMPIPVKFGEQNPKSKLTIEQVRFIRTNPNMGHKEIADMYGLSPNCIRGVRIGRTWKGVE